MRKHLFAIAAVALMLSSASSFAANISNVEYQALSQADAVKQQQQLTINAAQATAGVNPQYDQSRLDSPYDQGDLYAGRQGFMAGDWNFAFKASGVGTSD